MVVAIRGCKNDSDKWVSVINPERLEDSKVCGPKREDRLHLWISQQGDRRPTIQTKKGVMWIQDDDYRVVGEWDWKGPKLELARVHGSQTDFRLDISADGEITLTKL
ncbi:hypothetical protein ACGFX8_35690 [Streptomyces sp. NPDC048362]|uniref:hypothetical protein n=1 Tax=Streptomyces sp. NPDC048362 TaxID=3365539 RepID=UPI0037159D02